MLWEIPATAEDTAEAAAWMLSATEIGLSDAQRSSPQERAVFARLLRSYGYTRAELMLAMREVPRDPERFGGRQATVQDVERVVVRHRRFRSMLSRGVTTREKEELCGALADEIDTDGFRCCGFNERNEPLWRYAPNTPKSSVQPTPVLEEPAAPDTSKRTGLVSLGGAL